MWVSLPSTEPLNIKDKVHFEYRKAGIKDDSFGLLDDVAATINAYPRIKKLEVQGHTDHAGSAKYNKKLSDARAKAVMDYLVSKGVDANRLTSNGYGFDKPVVPLPENGKETKEGAEQNRRVEFVITEQDEIRKSVLENEVPDGASKVPTKTESPANKINPVKPATPQ